MDDGTESDRIGKLPDFPADVFASVASRCSPQDIATLACCSTQLRAFSHDEQRIWRVLCEERFGQQTPIDSWLTTEPSCPSSSGLRLYRHLYPVLASHAGYVGVWHKPAAAAGPKGALYSFRWAAAGIDVVQLVPSRRFLTHITHDKLCTVGPNHPRYQAEVVDGTKCVLRDYGSSCASGVLNSNAAAAACVAAGGASSSRSMSGAAASSSSQGSAGFCYELLRFMQSSVQKTRSSRRAHRRSGGSDSHQPILHHFSKVLSPTRQPGKLHPHQLAGLWKGLYGPHGCELLSVSYDFSGRKAMIMATKLTGDVNVPAGEVTWRAAAAAVPTPWPDQEQQLLALRQHLVALSAATAARMAERETADEAAGDVIAALMQQEEPPQQAMQLMQQEQAAGAGVAAAAGISELQQQQQDEASKVAAWAAAMQKRRVVGVYRGQGRVASQGFQNPSWVEGRLWVYEDGTCGFVYLLDGMVCHLIDLERLDSDL